MSFLIPNNHNYWNKCFFIRKDSCYIKLYKILKCAHWTCPLQALKEKISEDHWIIVSHKLKQYCDPTSNDADVDVIHKASKIQIYESENCNLNRRSLTTIGAIWKFETCGSLKLVARNCLGTLRGMLLEFRIL